ncbi:hypothetical protein COO60DRAFT_1524818 [Scenedesmus sp. NREL 46B-D3]|nr:hypothetical protein COO60DRAFT_1524818 [Scenedesmus sp. NREL 46B-D3]
MLSLTLYSVQCACSILAPRLFAFHSWHSVQQAGACVCCCLVKSGVAYLGCVLWLTGIPTSRSLIVEFGHPDAPCAYWQDAGGCKSSKPALVMLRSAWLTGGGLRCCIIECHYYGLLLRPSGWAPPVDAIGLCIKGIRLAYAEGAYNSR